MTSKDTEFKIQLIVVELRGFEPLTL